MQQIFFVFSWLEQDFCIKVFNRWKKNFLKSFDTVEGCATLVDGIHEVIKFISVSNDKQL